ncbi:MAG: hypothetical protein VYE22_21125 [Myxococcota bacterium]|nr:hypothetical protein [Myxococcota bacterium]
MSATIEFFERAVSKHKRQTRIACVVMIVVAVGGGAWGLSEPSPDRAMARMMAMCGLALVACVGMLAFSLLPHRGLAALRDPSRIVWCYGVAKQGYVQRVVIGLEDGKVRTLPVPGHEEGARALALLRDAAPHAATGFTEELRVRFKKDPASLRAA